MLAFLGKASIVNDPGDRRGKGALDPFGHGLPKRQPVPGTLIEELLPVLLVAIGQAGGPRASALTVAIEQQTAKVNPRPGTSVFAPQRK